jgi:hypothetical protein
MSCASSGREGMGMNVRERCFWGVLIAAALALMAACVSGCSTLDGAYRREATWTERPVVQVRTNEVVEARVVPVVREPGVTNWVPAVVTNFLPVFMTNLVRVPATNLVARPEALAAIEATGSAVNAFAPGIGSVLALVLGGIYHGYRQVRNRKVNGALIQGVETARAVLATTPQGQVADAQLVKWLMVHQKEAGVFATVSGMVDELSDNPAARVVAEEIAERLQIAQRAKVQGT